MKARARISILFSLITFVVLLVSMLAFVIFGVILIKLGIVKVDRGLPEIFMLALFMLASILVGMFAHLILCKVPLSPIENLIEGMEQLTNGKFETRVDLGEGVVLNRLAETFNKLAEELSNTEMLRSDFINNFSHEFKTPIVSILGFAKILNKCELEPEKQKEYLQAIEEEAERLSVMTNSILTLTKIENQIDYKGLLPRMSI